MSDKEKIEKLEKDVEFNKNRYFELMKEFTIYKISHDDWKGIAQNLSRYLDKIK